VSGREPDALSSRRTLAAATARDPVVESLARDLLCLRDVVAHVKSFTLDGIEAVLLDVECEVTKGLPFYNVVGLAAPSV